jgi:hypothetical protein
MAQEVDAERACAIVDNDPDIITARCKLHPVLRLGSQYRNVDIMNPRYFAVPQSLPKRLLPIQTQSTAELTLDGDPEHWDNYVYLALVSLKTHPMLLPDG